MAPPGGEAGGAPRPPDAAPGPPAVDLDAVRIARRYDAWVADRLAARAATDAATWRAAAPPVTLDDLRATMDRIAATPPPPSQIHIPRRDALAAIPVPAVDWGGALDHFGAIPLVVCPDRCDAAGAVHVGYPTKRP